MNLIKYLNVLSYPISFILIVCVLKRIPEFDPKKFAFSKSIFYIKNKYTLFLFRMVFIFKGIADLLFACFVIDYFGLSLNQIWVWPMLISPILFLSASYFTEKSAPKAHRFTAYLSGVVWFFSGIYLSILLQNTVLIIFTFVIAFISIPTIYIVFRKGILNYYIQLAITIPMWMWAIWFTILI